MQTPPGLKYRADKGHDHTNTENAVKPHVTCCLSSDLHVPMPVSTQWAGIMSRQVKRWRDVDANMKLINIGCAKAEMVSYRQQGYASVPANLNLPLQKHLL